MESKKCLTPKSTATNWCTKGNPEILLVALLSQCRQTFMFAVHMSLRTVPKLAFIL